MPIPCDYNIIALLYFSGVPDFSQGGSLLAKIGAGKRNPYLTNDTLHNISTLRRCAKSFLKVS